MFYNVEAGTQQNPIISPSKFKAVHYGYKAIGTEKTYISLLGPHTGRTKPKSQTYYRPDGNLLVLSTVIKLALAWKSGCLKKMIILGINYRWKEMRLNILFFWTSLCHLMLWTIEY